MSYENYIWLALGLIPYAVKRQYLSGGVATLEIRALFWSLIIHSRSSGRNDWSLRVPLIERLRDVVWAVLTRLHPNDADEDEPQV